MNANTLDILSFIATSDFRLAPNPAKYIMDGYVRKTKSSIQWSDFLRIILQLEKDGHLLKSTGLYGEDCYFLTLSGQEIVLNIVNPIRTPKSTDDKTIFNTVIAIWIGVVSSVIAGFVLWLIFR